MDGFPFAQNSLKLGIVKSSSQHLLCLFQTSMFSLEKPALNKLMASKSAPDDLDSSDWLYGLYWWYFPQCIVLLLFSDVPIIHQPTKYLKVCMGVGRLWLRHPCFLPPAKISPWVQVHTRKRDVSKLGAVQMGVTARVWGYKLYILRIR